MNGTQKLILFGILIGAALGILALGAWQGIDYTGIAKQLIASALGGVLGGAGGKLLGRRAERKKGKGGKSAGLIILCIPLLAIAACGASPLERNARIVQASHASLSGAADAIETWADQQADKVEELEKQAQAGEFTDLQALKRARRIQRTVDDVIAAHDLSRVAHRLYATAALIQAGDETLDLADVRAELVEAWASASELLGERLGPPPAEVKGARADQVVRIAQHLLVRLWNWIAAQTGGAVRAPPDWMHANAVVTASSDGGSDG